MAPGNKSNARKAAATPAGGPPDGVKKTRGRPRLPRDAKGNEQQAQQANVNAQNAGGFDVAQALKSLDEKLGAKITKITGDVTRLSIALEKMLDNGMIQAEGAVLFEPRHDYLVHISKPNTINTQKLIDMLAISERELGPNKKEALKTVFDMGRQIPE